MLLFINRNMRDHPEYARMNQEVDIDTVDEEDKEEVLPFVGPDDESEWELAGCPKLPSLFRALPVPEYQDDVFSSQGSIRSSQSSTSTGANPPLPSLGLDFSVKDETTGTE